ncbi:MAG: hypothetical protein ACRD2W_06920 [Acidimicrobiales bacterium]
MNRTVRTLATLGLTFTLSAAAGAGIASAQEMEHGRTRPVSRAVNQVKTQDAAMAGYAGYIRG